MTQLRCCLVGLGHMGREHARFIQQSRDGSLYAVVDHNQELAAHFAEQNHCHHYNNLEQALDDPQVEAIVIATPTESHAEIVIQAAKAGLPIFCEKPIDLDISRIDHCLKVVESHDVPMQVGFHRRFDPSFRSFAERLHGGAVGQLEMLSICSREWQLPDLEYLRHSGGIFRDMTLHDFDIARWLLQEEPVEVYATGSCLVDSTLENFGDVDSAMLVLRTASGRLCQISNSRRSAHGYDQRLEAFGSEGMLQVENPSQTTVSFSGESGSQTDRLHQHFTQRYAQAYQNQMEHFFSEVIRGKSVPLISGVDGRQAIVIADAAARSYLMGQPVAIPEPAAVISIG